jgi:hypothetical protein
VRSNGMRDEIHGSGHHGADMIGISAVRAGKGMRPITAPPTAMRLV